MSGNKRIQTGACSNIPKKVFTLSTPNMRKKSNTYLDGGKAFKFSLRKNTLMVYTGQNQRNQITKRIDDGENMINLMVSSFTYHKKLSMLESSKRDFCVNNNFKRNKHRTEKEGLCLAGF